jgi:hypothetical protein
LSEIARHLRQSKIAGHGSNILSDHKIQELVAIAKKGNPTELHSDSDEENVANAEKNSKRRVWKTFWCPIPDCTLGTNKNGIHGGQWAGCRRTKDIMKCHGKSKEEAKLYTCQERLPEQVEPPPQPDMVTLTSVCNDYYEWRKSGGRVALFKSQTDGCL